MKSIYLIFLEAFRSLIDWKRRACLNPRASRARPDSGRTLAAVSFAMSGPRHSFPWLEHSQAITAIRQVGNKYCRIVGHLKRSSRSRGLDLDRLQLEPTGVPGKSRPQMAGGRGECHSFIHIKVPLPSCRKIRINYSSFFWNRKREIKLEHQVWAPPEFPSSVRSRLKGGTWSQSQYSFP